MERERVPPSLVFLLSTFLACGASKGAPPTEPGAEVAVDAATAMEDDASPGGALYDRIGGRKGIDAIVDAFLRRLIADPRLSAFFRHNKSGLARFRQQLCQLSGGPCQYGGKDMKTAHRGMGLSDAQFDAFIEDFKLALAENGVSEPDARDLVAPLMSMRTDIVEKGEKKRLP
jgi:hemoglobin